MFRTQRHSDFIQNLGIVPGEHQHLRDPQPTLGKERPIKSRDFYKLLDETRKARDVETGSHAMDDDPAEVVSTLSSPENQPVTVPDEGLHAPESSTRAEKEPSLLDQLIRQRLDSDDDDSGPSDDDGGGDT